MKDYDDEFASRSQAKRVAMQKAAVEKLKKARSHTPVVGEDVVIVWNLTEEEVEEIRNFGKLPLSK